MRFKASIQNITTFTKLTASLNSLGPLAWVKLSDEQVCFTIIPEQGTQVWAVLSIDTIFETYTVQSAANNVINLEVPLTSLNRALKSALNATSAQIRLTKKDNLPLLALTIATTSSSNSYAAFPTTGANNEDGLNTLDASFGGGSRETIVTQEVPVRVLGPDTVAGLHEPQCREPDVHIILPPLMQLKSISDRFTKLALLGARSGTTASRTRLEVAANMHGCLRMSIKTDAMSISSVWTDLNNPELDPGQVAGGDIGIAEHPSTRMKQLGSADGRSEEGWATVRIDGRDWGKVMSVGRLGGRVIACFCHEHALILYVYLPNDNGDDESVLTRLAWRFFHLPISSYYDLHTNF
ncbi:Hus1-like protein [Lindgomyces ingoldianus]|uniref:Hus1-like protein n=1 Tax=Lindgomyces ingoldianus TaxID=673940 RepID=A0ACB6QWD0_9PLEO|nr:Hus1-like protein [Lindgomyces ingoldianus]KAF2471176.1 Hus1-like protein [Lindgomyces ingoldianus]